MCDGFFDNLALAFAPTTKPGPDAVKVTGTGLTPGEFYDFKSGGTEQEKRAKKAREEDIAETREEMSNLPDQSDKALQNARLMERRRQMGLSTRNSTFLAKDPTAIAPTVAKTLLGQ